MLKISITLKNLFNFSKFNQLKDSITEETTVTFNNNMADCKKL